MALARARAGVTLHGPAGEQGIHFKEGGTWHVIAAIALLTTMDGGIHAEGVAQELSNVWYDKNADEKEKLQEALPIANDEIARLEAGELTPAPSEAAPPEVMTQTVNIVVVMLTSGVPEIVPFMKFRTAVSAGKIDQLLTLPPLTGFIVTLRVRVKLLGLYAKSTASSSTVMLRVVLTLSPVLLEHTV